MSSAAMYMNNRSEERIYRNRIRRQRELRQHIIICIISILLIVTLVFLFGSSKSIASNKSDQILYKHFTSIQVQYGDSLSSIADTYVNDKVNSVDSFINEVVYMNDISNPDYLVAGTYIIVPYYSTVSD